MLAEKSSFHVKYNIIKGLYYTAEYFLLRVEITVTTIPGI